MSQGSEPRFTRSIAGSLSVAGLALALVLPGALRASDNLLTNPELAEAALFSGWTIFFADAIDWTGVDANGCAGSGSVQLGSATTDTGTQWAQAGQCQVLDGANWASGAHAAFSYFSADATLNYAQYLYYSDTACGLAGGSYLGSSTHQGTSGPGWHRVEISVFAFPAGANSVAVDVGAEAAQPTPLELLFDRAYFGHRPVLFTDDFETNGGTCRWSAVAP